MHSPSFRIKNLLMLEHMLFFFRIIYPLLFSSDKFHKLETSCHFIEADTLDNFRTDEKIPLLFCYCISRWCLQTKLVGNCARSCTHPAGRGPDPGGLTKSKYTNTHLPYRTCYSFYCEGLKRAAKREDRKGNDFLSWGLTAGMDRTG